MLTVSIPKLLQETNKIKQALEQMGAGVPAGISAAEMADRIAALENIISERDKVNAQRTQLVNSKADVAKNVSDYIVQVRAVRARILRNTTWSVAQGQVNGRGRRRRISRWSKQADCPDSTDQYALDFPANELARCLKLSVVLPIREH